MANYRKTSSAAKPAHSVNELFKEVQSPVTEETQETTIKEPVKETSVKTKETAVKTEKKKFGQNDGIPCKSITSGGLYMDGIKTHIPYEWYDKGAVTEVEYQDLVAAVRSNSAFVFKPYFIIEDNDFLAEFPQVKKVVESLYSLDDLEDVFKLSANDMIATIKAMPEGAQESVKHIASKMISNGALDSVRKINALDNYFGTKLILLTGLFAE